MRILAIETSCDETALALIEILETTSAGPKFKILANQLVSQMKLHAEFGGVFPTLAKREHARAIGPLFTKLLDEAKLSITYKPETDRTEIIRELLIREPEVFLYFAEHIIKMENPGVDAIAVTAGPGLEPALWVGINFARALATLWHIPLIPANHMEGHIVSIVAQESGTTFSMPPLSFPALSLLVSGGHTELVLVEDWLKYKKIGETRDDAVGEAFDKVARMLGLPYPGGPEISRLADEARRLGLPSTTTFPRPMLTSPDFDFSFSGLKTSVLYHIRDLPKPLSTTDIQNIARAFEDAAIDVLVKKTMRAIEMNNVQTVLVGGGVANNNHLQRTLRDTIASEHPDIKVYFPRVDFSTDNALMIGIAGFLHIKDGTAGTHIEPLKAQGNLSL